MTTRTRAVLAVFAAGAFGQQHPVSAPTSPGPWEKIPSYTLRSHQSSSGGDFGFDATIRIQSTQAVDRDGSESTTVTGTQRRNWFLPARTEKKTELVLRQQDRRVFIDHGQRIYETHAGMHKNMPSREKDDLQCSRAKSLYRFSERLPDTVIAGVPVVGYRGRDDAGADTEVYFAPSIGCQEMRFHSVKRGIFGWTTAESDRVVDSYEPGPPSPTLFTIPAGYRQVASILHP